MTFRLCEQTFSLIWRRTLYISHCQIFSPLWLSCNQTGASLLWIGVHTLRAACYIAFPSNWTLIVSPLLWAWELCFLFLPKRSFVRNISKPLLKRTIETTCQSSFQISIQTPQPPLMPRHCTCSRDWAISKPVRIRCQWYKGISRFCSIFCFLVILYLKSLWEKQLWKGFPDWWSCSFSQICSVFKFLWT